MRQKWHYYQTGDVRLIFGAWRKMWRRVGDGASVTKTAGRDHARTCGAVAVFHPTRDAATQAARADNEQTNVY